MQSTVADAECMEDRLNFATVGIYHKKHSAKVRSSHSEDINNGVVISRNAGLVQRCDSEAEQPNSDLVKASIRDTTPHNKHTFELPPNSFFT